MDSGKTYELYGSVESVTFRNEDTGFTVITLDSNGVLVTAVGVLPDIYPGEELTLRGTWQYHASFGQQFRAEMCERRMPVTAAAILRYLSSGALRGVGPATASKIVELFGEQSLEVIEKEPERLAQIKGITKAKAEKLSEELKSQFGVREVMLSLGRYGLTPNEILRIWKAWGVLSQEKISENPYELCAAGLGISFERADAIAARMERAFDSMFRTKAGVMHVLRHNTGNGHTCLPADKLSEVAAAMLGVPETQAEDACEILIAEGELKAEMFGSRRYVFLRHMHKAEQYSAQRLKLMLALPPEGISGYESDVESIERSSGVKYELRQREAIAAAMEKGILILTGGPGTGKTTTLNAIIDIFEKRGLNVAIAAPTGRAAKRISEITGRDAKTIHRLLEAEYSQKEKNYFSRDEYNPLECDALVIDELSMTDSMLFESVLRALPLGCRLIMVGDANQLPSVGAGNVLQDLIESGIFPVVELTEIFRQAQESMIVTNAHRIIGGEMPALNSRDSDFFFISAPDAVSASEKITQLYTHRLPTAYGYDMLRDIQILCPSRKGSGGTVNINNRLQEEINPAAEGKHEIALNGYILREGDKVMQTKNNYDIEWERADGVQGKGVFNGDVGILSEINKRAGVITVMFDEREAQYDISEADELELAYAVTVHKSQGSEFNAVIMPVCSGPVQLYFRNLLYTAVTRAKKIMLLVGQSSTVRAMVDNNRRSKRYTALRHFLTREADAV